MVTGGGIKVVDVTEGYNTDEGISLAPGQKHYIVQTPLDQMSNVGMEIYTPGVKAWLEAYDTMAGVKGESVPPTLIPYLQDNTPAPGEAIGVIVHKTPAGVPQGGTTGGKEIQTFPELEGMIAPAAAYKDYLWLPGDENELEAYVTGRATPYMPEVAALGIPWVGLLLLLRTVLSWWKGASTLAQVLTALGAILGAAGVISDFIGQDTKAVYRGRRLVGHVKGEVFGKGLRTVENERPIRIQIRGDDWTKYM